MTTFNVIKSPDSVVPYSIDWSDTLNTQSPNDTISTSVWTGTKGLTIDSDSKTTTETHVVVSGGTVYNYGEIENTITTAAGHTHVRTVVVSIQPR